MLGNASIIAAVPITDLARAKVFYVDILGFHVLLEDPEQRILIVRGNGSMLELVQQETASSGSHTCAIFMLGDNFEDVVDRLIDRGVTFDVREIPTLDIQWDERGFGIYGDRKTAWFKDPDGNVLQLYAGKSTRGSS